MKYLVSACLANQPVRYDGQGYHIEKIQQLIRNKLAICVCPELLGGLSTPRAPAEIQQGTARDVLLGKTSILTTDDEDVTEAFLKGAYTTLEIARQYQITTIVLKENSPSCGRHFVYDGTFSGHKIAGSGITASLLMQHGFHVMSEEEFLAQL